MKVVVQSPLSVESGTRSAECFEAVGTRLSSREIRNPKTEGRKKSEDRNPSHAALAQPIRSRTAPHSDFGFRPSFGFRISAFGFRPSPFGLGTSRPRAEQGVALVITLIMLSVITFMAIAFLVLSRGERGSVGTSTDQSLARLGADNALERAQIEVVAPMLASGNPFSSGLLVSTNYINPWGFTNGVSSPLNVAYYDTKGVPLIQGSPNMLLNLTNLLFNPRPPVFIVTNRVTGATDFRYYLDLNRNGVFDSTGWQGLTNSAGVGIPGAKGILTSYLAGDPQWIGGLEFPDRHHAADNRFLYRYAYLVVPAGQTLDINYIHNYAKSLDPLLRSGVGDGFLRNQGVGTWEVNLGAFLADLNTNVWATNAAPYSYSSAPLSYTLANRGVAFDDALSILRYRYSGNLITVSNVVGLFGAPGVNAFKSDFIDGYSAGPPMTSTYWPGTAIDQDTSRVGKSWPGSDNLNHCFTTQDLFDPTKVSQSFVNHLLMAGADTNNTYNRSTFYRLLSQLGTDSAPEPPGKINLNYDNLVQVNARGIASATNFIPWRPVDFFTNTAAVLLADAGYTNQVSITNLAIYPTNYYTPSVHRLLQLAANIYDASTNRSFLPNQTAPYFPTVFRPIFRRVGTNIVIAGYREVVNADMANAALAPVMVELDRPNPPITTFPVYGTPFNPRDRNEPMVSGVPLIIGAKKGFPNFNELAMQTQIYVSRLLEFRRKPGDPNVMPVDRTNQMYVVGVTNTFGVEAWNSYLTNYPRDLQLVTAVNMTAIMTNELGAFGQPNVVFSNRVARAVSMPIPAYTWKGWTTPNSAAYAMMTPFGTTNTFLFLTNATALDQPPYIEPQTHIFPTATRGAFYVPHWWLNLNTRLLFILVDTRANRIVDYVNINDWERTVDVTAKLSEGNTLAINALDYKTPANEWITNRMGNAASINAPTYGIMNQILICLNGTTATDWSSYSQDPYAGLDVQKAIDGFRYNLGLTPSDSGKAFYKSNVFYAPYDPYRPIYIHTSWQANDPLVHYTANDLLDLANGGDATNVDFYPKIPPLANIGLINTRYRPWGGNQLSQDPLTDYQMAIKDPNVTRSDDWDFPTNKFPSIGWLGRVHRGTPWQTVFLKSTNYLQSAGRFDLSLFNWAKWTGNPVVARNWGQVLTNLVPLTNTLFSDAFFTAPTNDWHMLDLFTSAFNDNATRGQLSVNQTNLAAWSAVLSGVNVLPNASTNLFIQPAGVYNPALPPPLVTIVNGINNARTNFPNNAFSRLGDILATPELTIASPYLVSTNRAVINDAVVERIPQQILGLLHGGEQSPRFVIYSYGQALKPAPRSLVTTGPYLGLCTNYQITAEVATRAVVRVDGAPGKPRTVIESFNVLPPD